MQLISRLFLFGSILFLLPLSCTKAPDEVARPTPVLEVKEAPLTVILPGNCAQFFTVSNVGPAGSILDYTIDDNVTGSVGMLTFTNTSGALAAGEIATIGVNINASKLAGIMSSPGGYALNLSLNLNTPKALNYSRFPITVFVRSPLAVAKTLGKWSGTWSGTSSGKANPGETIPKAPVSGTWSLDCASNVLTWTGNDVYWTYTATDTINKYNSPIAHQLPISLTYTIDTAKISLSPGCDYLNFSHTATTVNGYTLNFQSCLPTRGSVIQPGCSVAVKTTNTYPNLPAIGQGGGTSVIALSGTRN
jgi:hypothetical protein